MTASLGKRLAPGKARSEPTQPTDRENLVRANLQPAMGFVEALGDVELLPGGVGEIALRLGPKGRLVLLYWQQIIGARRDDRLSDRGIAGDGVDGDERAVKVQLIEQLGDDDDLVFLLVHRLLGQDQAGVGGVG